MIADGMSLLDVQRLRAVCSTLRRNLPTVLRLRLIKALTPYFGDVGVSDFCATLRRSHALIGDSAPLSIINPADWKPGDLDIIVHTNDAPGFIQALLTEGYEQTQVSIGGSDQYVDEINGTVRIAFDYHCFMKNVKKFDLSVVKAQGMNRADYVLTYHSTAVMNFFDGRALYCMFPKETYQNRYMLNKYTPTARIEHGLEKMGLKGYEVVEPVMNIQDILPHGTFGNVKAKDVTSYWCQTVTL